MNGTTIKKVTSNNEVTSSALRADLRLGLAVVFVLFLFGMFASSEGNLEEARNKCKQRLYNLARKKNFTENIIIMSTEVSENYVLHASTWMWSEEIKELVQLKLKL